MMKIKYKAPLIILCVTLLTAAIAGYFDYSFNQDLIQNAKMKELRKVSTFIQNEIIRQSQKAVGLASLIAHEPWIKKSFYEGKRELLAQDLTPAFEIQREKYGITEATFWTPPAKAFLRIYNPKDFGDDQSTYRSMVLATNLQQEAKRGVEISQNGISMRGMVTVKDGQNFVGCFEIAMSFPKILSIIKENLRFDTGLFVDNSLMTKIAILAPKPAPDHVIAGFQLVETTNFDLIKTVATPDLLSGINDVTIKIGTKNGIEYGMTLIPLLDFTGNQIGSIVAVRDFQDFHSSLYNNVRNSLIFSIAQSLILSILAFVNFLVWIFIPLKKLNANLEKLADGNTDIDQHSYIHRDDAVGKLARSLVQMKNFMLENNKKS